MRTNQKLILIACAALVALGLAIFTLREDAVEVSPSLPGHGKTDAPSESPLHSSTSSSAHSITAASVDYFPISDTYQRNYLVEVSYKGAEPRFGLAKIAVEGRETIRGNEYYKVLLRVTGISEMRDQVLRYCRNAGEAWRELDEDRKSDPAFETVALPLPPRTGATWDKDTPMEKSTWKVEGTETVVLFGKPYPKCLRISYERRLKQEPDYFETGHYYLAPDVGLIQQIAMAAGTRITFSLDHRAPQAIAFFTAWSGSYEGVRDGSRSGGSIQLSADGRYTMIRSWADSAVDSGQYEPNPTQQGEMILRDNSGRSTNFSFRRKELGNGNAVLVLKCLDTGNLLREEFLRDEPAVKR